MKKGFTIIELMVSIAIISILSSIVVLNVADTHAKSRDTIRISDVKQLQLAIKTYFSNCYAYPPSLSALTSDCTGTSILPSIPKDPGTGLDYGYAVSNSPVRFHVCATLEKYTNVKGRVGGAPLPGGVTDPCATSNPYLYDNGGGADK